MSTSMFRFLLVLAAVPLGLLVLDGRGLGGIVPSALLSVVSSPTIEILGAPTEMILDEPGVVVVRASEPARPGETVVLETAGAYGLGYNRVSKAVLDEHLEATLTVTGRHFLGTYKYWAKIAASGDHQQGKSATIPVTIVAATAPLRPTCAGEAPLKQNGSAWTCTYNDEFDGSKLDRRFWAVQTSATTGTDSVYACGLDSPRTVDVVGGNLELSLIRFPEKQACSGKKSSRYAYGQVMHFQTYSQTYGKYEVRAKIPDEVPSGAQQSFWLWPKKNTYGSWPASGEIDFAEMYSSIPGLDRPYIHYLPGSGASGTNQNVTHADCKINVGRFNTYGVEWSPGRITVLLNGEVCLINDYSSVTAPVHGKNAPFDQPFYLAMNQAMGTVGNEYDPALMPEKVTTQIDYVRIWK
ncbi:MAG: glycoside hydrolase family 16 protein [Propionibacteriales bacterium]|nr:glycoside hydrolase family 16 protein [Propionibacteriales bacterium]